MPGFDDIPVRLDSLQRRDMYRRRNIVGSEHGRELSVDGQMLLNFCSNDYLGLASDERVRDAFRAGIDRWGAGAGASHLVCGYTSAHQELEEALAEFSGRERALLFSNGYAANLGVINALVGKGDVVFEDRLNHASLLDGGWISRASFAWFGHSDTDDLDMQLATHDDPAIRRLVVSDGTFSMDGDHCRLDELIAVARRRDAWLMIDDAHGFGVHGREGCGQVDAEHYSTGDVPVLVGTLGKAFGTFGAFVAGDEALIEWLIQRARNYIYTTALPAAVAAATLKSLELARSEDWRRERLAELILRFRAGAAELGFETSESTSPIQPLILGEPGRAVALSQALREHGLLITAIRPPTVPVGTSRLRITLSAAHTEDDVDRLLAALAEQRDLPKN